MNNVKKITGPCPFDEASFLGKLSFTWLIPLFKKGYQRDIELSDLHLPSCIDEPRYVFAKLDKEWAKEIKSSKKPNIVRAVVKAFGLRHLLICQLLFFSENVLRILQTFMVGNVAKYFSDPNQKSYHEVAYSLIMLCLFTAGTSLSRHHYYFLNQRSGITIHTSLVYLVYQKILRLDRDSLDKYTTGKILNIITNDLGRVYEFSHSGYYLVCAPVQMITVTWILWNYVGWGCLGGLGVMFLSIPLQSFLGRYFRLFRQRATVLTDQRVSLMNEIISSMKLIKLSCWEKPFSDMVDERRKKEITKITHSALLNALNVAIGYLLAPTMTFATFVIFILLGGSLTAETVFVTIGLFNACRLPVTRQFARAVGYAAELSVANDRLKEFLSLPERRERNPNTRKPGEIKMSNYSASWDASGDKMALNEINAEVDSGQLWAIVGPVGCGKSAMLSAIMNDLYDRSGDCQVSGKISYSPQESWCINATIRVNVIMCNKFDEKRYQSALYACALQDDIESFPEKDQTLIGEKGYKLSGGQKARISLARAIYHQADIYLLDDPLSAVDPTVAKHIFNYCIESYLRGKTVILVTHQLQFLDNVDMVITMADGRIDKIGKPVDVAEIVKSLSTSQQNLSIDAIGGSREPEIVLNQKSGKIEEEKKGVGHITLSVYWNYFKAGTGVPYLLIMMAIWVATQVVYQNNEFWLSNWIEKFQIVEGEDNNSTSALNYDPSDDVIFYSVLTSILCVLSFTRCVMLFYSCFKSSVNLHDSSFRRCLRAPLTFFETNPVGRILNRFTRDIGQIDQALPSSFMQVLLDGLLVTGALAVGVLVKPITLAPILIVVGLSIVCRNIYLKTSRDIKRFEALAQSPVYQDVATTVSSLNMIRAFDLEDRSSENFMIALEDATSAKFVSVGMTRSIGFILDFFCLIYLCIISALLILWPAGISGGYAGLLITSAVSLMTSFQGLIRSTTVIETNMVSVERIVEYQELESEASLTTKTNALKPSWPEKGLVNFKNVYLTYPGTDKTVLKNLTFSVEAGLKVGVVGRTGAGKSSLISVLFRLVEPEGVIEIDGINVGLIGLHDLRSKISIIPQDPVLFSGSIRKNLDPFNEFEDDRIWSALGEANLKQFVSNLDGQLDAQVRIGGSNLSAGQRQLLCLARALLKRNKIIVLDEATANVDQETDQLIQDTIRNKFFDSTVITIAHRLHTIIDMDKILVIDSGVIAEYDHPHTLFQNGGKLHEMVVQLGTGPAQHLFKSAEDSFNKKKL
ncbi:ATP-binding cassette sub-family C member 4 [Halotydeus destructor]|nr:ATP-binding cassette sub-family C member 4 [Halotydeus destructor]